MPEKSQIPLRNDTGFVNSQSIATALTEACRTCWPAVRAYVLANSGTVEDAEDLLQEAALVAYRQAKNDGLELSASWAAYLVGICKNEWLHRLRKKRQEKQVTDLLPMEYIAENHLEIEWRQSERDRLYLEKLDLLDDSCRQLIELSCQKVPLKQIAELLNYTYDYVRQKKPDCIAGLTKLIKQDKRFKDLI